MQILRNGQSPETFLSQYKISSFSLCQDYLKIICVLYSWQICNRKEWLPFPFLARQLHTASYTHLYTILYCTVLYYTILYYTILYYTILYYTILYCTVLYYTILLYAILCFAVLYYTILCYPMLCCTILILYTMVYWYYTNTLVFSLLWRQRMSDIEPSWEGQPTTVFSSLSFTILNYDLSRTQLSLFFSLQQSSREFE